MNEQILMARRLAKRALAALLVLYAGCLSGCGASLNTGNGAGLAERQVNEPNPSAADATGRAKEPASNAGQLAQAADTFTAMTTPGNSAYKIGPLDVLEISVFQVPELSKSVQVADAGTINLPLVGEVSAAGKTAQEIEHDLTAKLSAKYLRKPQVTVYVKEYNSQRVTIEGAVKKPGVYPIKGRTSLLQIVAMAESLDRETASSNVVVFRTLDGKRSAARFDIDAIRSGRAEDPPVQQGDVIVVDTSTSKVVLGSAVRLLPTAAAFVPLL